MNKYTLTFELNKDGDIVEIHGDRRGLVYLKEQIELVLNKEEHIHLMSPNWGGNELTEEKQGEVNTLVNHVKIFYWRE